MTETPVYLVSGSSNAHPGYVLRDSANALRYTDRPWGTSLAASWHPPDVALSEHPNSTAADFSAFYLPGLLVSPEHVARAIAYPQLELLPVNSGGENSVLLNPQRVIWRFHETGANFIRVPSGAIVILQAADFYADDIPLGSELFWLHDGEFPRFLLCNEAFKTRVAEAKLTGLSFTLLGRARSDG